MLSKPLYKEQPFPHFSVDETFPNELCKTLETLFTLEEGWQHRDGSFYQCAILDVTQHIALDVQQAVLRQLRELSGLPLVDHILVTAQRMQPGQAIGIHSDRPLLGFEILRLVVQFNEHWKPEHGGVLELFASKDGDAVAQVMPEYNKGFVFVLNENSYHGVTQAIQARRSLVFNFWHVANTPELEEHVNALFAKLHFSELPKSLDPIASAAASDLTEDRSLLADTAAVALKRWGYDDASIIKGYQYSAGLAVGQQLDDETFAAVRLADWVASLYRQSFDLDKWNDLYAELATLNVPARLEKTWRYCLPNL